LCGKSGNFELTAAAPTEDWTCKLHLQTAAGGEYGYSHVWQIASPNREHVSFQDVRQNPNDDYYHKQCIPNSGNYYLTDGGQSYPTDASTTTEFVNLDKQQQTTVCDNSVVCNSVTEGYTKNNDPVCDSDILLDDRFINNADLYPYCCKGAKMHFVYGGVESSETGVGERRVRLVTTGGGAAPAFGSTALPELIECSESTENSEDNNYRLNTNGCG